MWEEIQIFHRNVHSELVAYIHGLGFFSVCYLKIIVLQVTWQFYKFMMFPKKICSFILADVNNFMDFLILEE